MSETKKNQMSLEHKACQLTQLNAVYLQKESQAVITGTDEDLGLPKNSVYEMGSALNFMYGGEMSQIQKEYLENSEEKIPLIFMQDVIHGYRTIFPIPLGMGASFDTELVEECARMSAVEAVKNGVQVTFSPMVDLVRDSRWGRVMESTGEDPYLNGEMGKAFIRGYHKGGLACCVKHFAAYGAAEAGRDYNTTDLSWYALREFYLRAYKECLEEKPEMVMSSFNLLNGQPVNANHRLLVDVLRNEWGFDGVLISDYNAVREMMVHGFAEDEKECACIAINNEIDMEMMSATYIKYLPELVKEGKVSESTVDRMLERVLKLKEQTGLFETPYPGVDYEKGKELALSSEHRRIARVAAEKSMVLLKNDGVLPLNKAGKVFVTGPFAEEQGILGSWSCFGKAEEAVSVKMGIEHLLYQEVCRNEREADVIVVCIGESQEQSGEGASRAELKIEQSQIELLKQLRTTQKPIVAVVFGGRAQILTDVEVLSDAILYAWQPGTEGGNAIANILYGNTAPSGKLPISFPRATGQCPIYYNHFNTGRPKGEDDLENVYYNSSYRDVLNAPMYPFGYGLTYTEFSVENLQLSKSVMRQGETLTASIVLKNTGNRDGEEVVQLYLRDCVASMVRPVKELKAYRKVGLEKGAEQTVEFTVTEEMLKFYREDGTFEAEEGRFLLMIGTSSEQVLSKEFYFERESVI